METNKINNYICKLCDIDLVVEIFIYQLDLVIKMRLKKLGAIWDFTYKKWFINKNHKNVDIILQKWKSIW